DRAKIPPSAQIGRRVYLYFPAKRRGKKIGIAAFSKFGGRACGVATVAVAHNVNNIATQSHQLPVFPLQVQGNRGDFEPSLNPTLLSLVIVVMGSDGSRTVHHPRDNDRSECCDESRGF